MKILKTIHQTLLIVLLLSAPSGIFAQTWFYFSGSVHDVDSGMPVADYPVFIMADDSMNTQLAFTDQQGIYFDSLFIDPEKTDSVFVSVYDCNGIASSQTFTTLDSINFADFNICAMESDCYAFFEYEVDSADQNTVQFINLSEGDFTSWFWDFGDGTTSDTFNPVHQYDSPGIYEVCLQIEDSLSSCWDMYCSYVVVGETNCTADFEVVLDTLNNTRDVYLFKDKSEGNPENRLWDFGDGQVSFEQNPTHIYEQQGTYEVCLTISSDSTGGNCFDSKCQTITTPDYFDFGGQVFIGDYPLNIEENDSSNKAVAYLYRRFMNKWEFMDSREFWKFGYYWFTEKPAGEYIIRTDILPGSVEFGNYAPDYHNHSRFWTSADIFMLADSEQFAVNVKLKKLADLQTGTGNISGYLNPGTGCNTAMPLGGELVYLFNSVNQIVLFTYTNKAGEFSFDGLGFGSYGVKAEVTGKLSYQENFQLDQDYPSVTGISLDVYCNSYVSVNQIASESNDVIRNIYPQPASDKVYVELTALKSLAVTAELININGQAVWSEKVQLTDGNKTIGIDVKRLNPGLYLLRISSADGLIEVAKKIIVSY